VPPTISRKARRMKSSLGELQSDTSQYRKLYQHTCIKSRNPTIKPKKKKKKKKEDKKGGILKKIQGHKKKPPSD
jgi:hypothetical protein